MIMAITLTVGIVFLIFLIICIRNWYLNHNHFYLIPIVLILAFLIYTFGTTNGALRFAVLWTGHPVEAYTTDYREIDMKKDNKRYFITTDDIKGDNGDPLGAFEVNYYWIIKIAKYYGS